MLHSCHCASEEMYSSITSVLLQSLPQSVKPTNAACPVLVTNSRQIKVNFWRLFSTFLLFIPSFYSLSRTLLVILILLILIVHTCDPLENLAVHLTEAHVSSQQVQGTSASISSEKTAPSGLARVVLALSQACSPSQNHLQTP